MIKTNWNKLKKMGIIVIISSNIILPYLLWQAKSHHLPDNIPEQMSGTRQKELKIEHLLDKKGAIKEKAERVIIPKSIICWKISEHLSSLRSPLNIIPRVLFVISSLCFNNIVLLANSIWEIDRILWWATNPDKLMLVEKINTSNRLEQTYFV